MLHHGSPPLGALASGLNNAPHQEDPTTMVHCNAGRTGQLCGGLTQDRR